MVCSWRLRRDRGQWCAIRFLTWVELERQFAWSLCKRLCAREDPRPRPAGAADCAVCYVLMCAFLQSRVKLVPKDPEALKVPRVCVVSPDPLALLVLLVLL